MKTINKISKHLNSVGSKQMNKGFEAYNSDLPMLDCLRRKTMNKTQDSQPFMVCSLAAELTHKCPNWKVSCAQQENMKGIAAMWKFYFYFFY